MEIVEMTNVFIVTVQTWDDVTSSDDVEIRGVFSTFEKAQDFCGTLSDEDKVNATLVTGAGILSDEDKVNATINIFEVK